MKVILKPKREKPVIQNHPWIFSGAIQKIEGNPNDGDIVDVHSNNGNFLARGYINQKSQITVRILSRNENEQIDESFFYKRIINATNYRKNILHLDKFDAYRLIHDSADLLPGLIVDKYGDYIVIQVLSLGIEIRKEIIVRILMEVLSPTGIYERSDSGVRGKEGLEQYKGLVYGQEPPEMLTLEQNNVKMLVNIKEGQKTGTFLDQRENMLMSAQYSGDKDVLDCFCYTGSFAVNTAIGGAKSVVGVDTSLGALETAQSNAEINKVADVCQFVQKDVFDFLDDCSDKFDMIILDPPGFAKTDRAVKNAARAYKHINMKAMELLNPDGILMTFSCSHHIDPLLFRKIVFSASVDAGCDMQIIKTLHAAPDHPINIAHPEGEYLKGLICRKIP